MLCPTLLLQNASEVYPSHSTKWCATTSSNGLSFIKQVPLMELTFITVCHVLIVVLDWTKRACKTALTLQSSVCFRYCIYAYTIYKTMLHCIYFFLVINITSNTTAAKLKSAKKLYTGRLCGENSTM